MRGRVAVVAGATPGAGIAIRTGHLDSAQVGRPAQRIRHDHGAIDVLGNDIWGAERLKGGPVLPALPPPAATRRHAVARPVGTP